jgi:hypothetical protein
MMITDVKTKLFFLLIVVLNCPAAVRAQEEEAAVRQSIQFFFEGFAKGDTVIMSSVMDQHMTLQTVMEKPGEPVKVYPESRQEFLKAIAGMSKEKIDERIISWDIHVDGAYASAWCKYQLFVDTVFYHWGIDNFQMIKENNRWKIMAITDTRRKPATFTSEPEDRKKARKEIDLLMDAWHKSAAQADEKIFFGSMDPSSVYLGTDKTENWTKQDFEKWSKKYFDQDKAWDFKPHDRHIYFSDEGNYAWLDELLDTQMGVCRGSGVLAYKNGEWKILHYNLAVTVPNEKMKEFVKINK